MEKEKKEIWMEKLIELLNECKPLKKYKEYWYIWNEIYLYTYAEDYWASKSRNITLDVISKQYWFIKWLVENDKIDTESYCRVTSIERKWEKDVYRDEVDSLLMLLAIQDEPIRFLCEILK